MAQQWRVECENCGTEQAEKLRMHSQLSKSEVRKRLKDDPRDDDDEGQKVEGTFVECNVCGTMREVEN